jgi:hypothetical protein
MEVILKHEVGAFGQWQCDAFRKRVRLLSRRPAAERRAAPSSSAHAAEAGLAVRGIRLTRGAGCIAEEQDVMHRAPCRRTEFDRAHSLVFGE